MPKIGDVCYARDLGKGDSKSARKYIFCKCPECGRERWLALRSQNTNGQSRCQSCCGKEIGKIWLPTGRGDKSPRWKGGRRLHHQGYVEIWISEENPYYPMATHKRRGGGNIFEHRLVMAKSIGRCLSRQEHVHHINGIKSDNSIENLELISPTNHLLYKYMCTHCKLRKENRQLRNEITVLKSQPPMLFIPVLAGILSCH